MLFYASGKDHSLLCFHIGKVSLPKQTFQLRNLSFFCGEEETPIIHQGAAVER